MRVGSLFSGVGMFDLAAERAGCSIAWQCEVDKAARLVLQRHWPDVTLYQDVKELNEHILEPVNIVCAGFPCQDLSVAGKRAGLDGKRSGLFFDLVRILAGVRPRWCLLENVPGLLSSNGGRDMGSVVGALGQLGYSLAYRVLDAQWFGVPQRRRRVFIVGYLGDWRYPAKVLFERESLRRDTPPRRGEGQVTAGTLASRTGAGGFPGTDEACSGYVQPVAAYSIQANYSRTSPGDPCHPLAAGAHPPAVASTVYAIQAGATRENPNSGPKGCGVREWCAYTLDTKSEVQCVTHALRGEGFDASEDGTGRGTPLVPVAFGGNNTFGPIDVSPALNAHGGPMGRMDFESEAFVMNLRGRDGGAMPEISNVASLRAASGGSSRSYVATHAVRRLTPRECERLMGLPDDWTRWRADGTEQADGPRYKQCGNGVVVPVAEWIIQRIMNTQSMEVAT